MFSLLPKSYLKYLSGFKRGSPVSSGSRRFHVIYRIKTIFYRLKTILYTIYLKSYYVGLRILRFSFDLLPLVLRNYLDRAKQYSLSSFFAKSTWSKSKPIKIITTQTTFLDGLEVFTSIFKTSSLQGVSKNHFVSAPN